MPSPAFCIAAVGHGASVQLAVPDQTSLGQAAALGFEALLWRSDGRLGDVELVPAELIEACAAAGLRPMLAIDVARFPVDHPLVADAPELFAIRRSADSAAPIDPRRPAIASGEARARLGGAVAMPLLEAIADQLLRAAAAGVVGFTLLRAEKIAQSFLNELSARLKAEAPEVTLGIAAGLDGQPPLGEGVADFASVTIAADRLRARALVPAVEALRTAVPVIAEAADEVLRGDDLQAIGSALLAAAAVGQGIVVPFEIIARHPDLAAQAVAAVRQLAPFGGELRRVTGPGGAVVALLRSDSTDLRDAGSALLVLANLGGESAPAPAEATLLPAVGAAFEAFVPLAGEGEAFAALAPGEVRLLSATRARPITDLVAIAAEAAAEQPRLVVEDITPSVAGGFPVKRVVGEAITVDARVYADGHEQLAAELLWRPCDQDGWTAVRMAELPNDGWRASFALPRLGRHEFAVEAWLDRFGAFRRDFRKKLDAGVAQPVDHAEGLLLVEQARDRATGDLQAALAEHAARIAAAGDESAALLLAPELATRMDEADDRPHRVRSAVQPVDAERLEARFSSWYELFPRSATNEKQRHGTFRDVIERLPAIRDMGFDTLYFPPIHPIGKINRKGPNNTLTPGPDDPGSPYAVGSADGGHEAIHPELGGFEEFAALVAAARDHGLEIALDFAIQCAPDHPWLKQHPGWFAWRPDGSMKYAENPPKKYQDIVNVDFYGPDAVPGLWTALRDVVLLWVSHGVKTFRVDNPHTKPLPFWEWMIGEVRAAHPEVIFLAEAFTGPAMMYRLAKVGFSQSYTYFTWRDRKGELTDYITELTTTAPREFYRPHFFVNTPDINPLFLQTSGRPGFRIRAVLAATLSGLFGVYSGFELCEAAPVPGREEYLDSEKYELRPRDYQAPGNIIADITLLNRLRRAYPALQTHLNTRFYVARNDAVMWYGKPAPDGSDMIMVMVSLDPHSPQTAEFEVPLWEFGRGDDASITVEDLVGGERFRWTGKTHTIRLDPEQPYRIWRLAPGEEA